MALLRGRFECASLSRIYGFYDECKRRYSPKLWKDFTAVHNTMPWACVVQNSILCVHSGLSSELTSPSPRYLDQQSSKGKNGHSFHAFNKE